MEEIQREVKPVRIGLIGAGFMGRCHAHAFRSVGGIFDLENPIELYMLADLDQECANKNAKALGFKYATSNWRELVSDDSIDIVAITTPNVFHEEMAIAAIEAGKTVYCEKPLSTNLDSAKRMVRAASDNKVLTVVGFNFLRNPLIAHAKKLIKSGELGELVSFRGRHAEYYMPKDAPHSFRTEKEGGGALADIGSHIVAIARYLLGDIKTVCTQSQTIHKQRRSGTDEGIQIQMKESEVDDVSHSLVEFSSGLQGSIDVSWIMSGRNMNLEFEITGTEGAIIFNQERMNELLLWKNSGSEHNNGFRKIETSPDHPPYGNFCPAPGHQIGFNDLKIIEVAELVDSHNRGILHECDFFEAYQIMKVIDAMQCSAQLKKWVEV
ncbi:Oxidoreductase domain protein [Vibrio nigripulchritudo SOn1]|uniref:Oxidoreductase domain protein n=1 Tax=Vibrio nigripulchritudo SOn1 TaxID=1238450 RepID=A0AAV2VTZ8_9VIBR|nr:Gfo/Idh/MocA family oxidoreductase [Vibrio nigripulchritudo]CCO47867.1 Oxidoreductase domain protein [Vibrio nigripulchritudo SOn1]